VTPAKAAAPRGETFDWREVASLGEQLVSTNSLTAQRDRILAMTSRLIEGQAEVWLHENMFRLPDWEAGRAFPSHPLLAGMQRAIARRKPCIKAAARGARSRNSFVAVPIEDQGFLLGALQVSRPRGPNFQKDEIELIESLASVVAVGLYASHRVEVERFRLGQLNLVREVSAQIANVLDIDALAQRVTELIQKTFKYYYVAIFTLRPGAASLRFRASASAPRKGRRKAGIALEVEVGQGLIGEAVASGQRIAVADVRKDGRFRFIDSLPETRSELVIPLKIEERVLGALDIQSNRLNAFHRNDLLLLEALTDNIARAVEGAWLYSDLNRRADQFGLIAEVSKSVTSTLDLTGLMSEAAALIQTRFGFPFVHLFTVHPNRRVIEFEAGSGGRSQALEGYSLPLDDSQGIIPTVAREGRTLLANDVTLEPLYRPSPLPMGRTRSELCVPLLFGDKVLGVLDIQSEKRNAFSEEDRVMFEAVAGTIAAAARNADLYRSEQWRRQMADSVREVAGLLSSNVGVDEVLDSILTELERNLPVDISAIWLLGDGDLYLAASHGADPQLIEQVRLNDPAGALSLTQAMMADGPVIRKPGDPLWTTGQAAGFDPSYSALAAPLHIADQPVGVISLAHRAPGRYGHEAQAMVTTFASYAAVAIENARLYDAAQEQAYASAALLQVAQATVSLSDVNEALGTIVRILPILVGVERAALYLWGAERELYHAVDAYGLDEAARAVLSDEDLPAGRFPLLDAARQSNAPVLVPIEADAPAEGWTGLQRSDLAPDEILKGEGPLLMAVPLAVKSDVFGVLLLQEARGARRFRTRRLEIINGIAQQAALAIQNDRLEKEMVGRERLETEVQLARQIQQAFIPEALPALPGWEFAARWKTARQMGGDFYDLIELPDHRLGLLVADVADKGIPAALFMALTRSLVRAAVMEIASPAEALLRVNDLLIPDTRQGIFVTAFYAVLDQETGQLEYANAGHNPPLWLRADGGIQRLTRTGVALGVLTASPMSENSIQIGRGEALFLYTDGLTEEFSEAGEIFGESRLLEVVKGSASASATQLLDKVETQLNDFINFAPLTDDLTMLVVKRQ
jgi:phosphoserine phosphatase RsbU/P